MANEPQFDVNERMFGCECVETRSLGASFLGARNNY